MLDQLLPKIHKEGYKFIAISLIASFFLILFSKFLGIVGILFSIWVYYFFRDPDRAIINDNRYLVSPASGIITKIVETNGPKELGLQDKKYTRVSIFMNVFDCHVNRIPTSGTIEEISYVPGKFFNATLDKSSEENERNYLKIKDEKNEEVIVVQIAGLLARRIVCDLKKAQTLKQGERIGMIRFGSRVDLYFNNKKILVREQQNSISGETLIAVENGK
jgi:phosphatidylserine decarboxylase